jgi:hypothetical protein
MNLPGFTAEAAVETSHRSYRQSFALRNPASVVVPQQGSERCFDYECATYCSERTPWDAARCWDSCEIPCRPLGPDEILLPG